MPSQTVLPLNIDIVSDVVCPWCYIGKRRIERAITLSPELAVDVTWRPFQLDPTIPAGGLDRQEYMQRKFGSSDKAKAISTRIAEEGEADGIAFRFDKIKRSPNTLDAHRLIRWAGPAGTQDDVVEALFRRFFLEGEDIGDRSVLTAIASEAGMDADLVGELLQSNADTERVNGEIANAAAVGVTGVPCFIFADRLAIPGAQEPATLARYMQKIAAKAARENVAEEPATLA